MSDTLLLNGECVETMRGFGDATVDAVVCDPPYHLTSIVDRFGRPDAAPSVVAQEEEVGFGVVTHGGDGIALRAVP